MKKRGFTLEGFNREWEQTGKAYVYATKEVELSNIEKTIGTIDSVIAEFNLPLKIHNGNANLPEDALLIETLIASNAQENLLDGDSALEKLCRYWNEGVLRYGLIVLVNEKYRLKYKPSEAKPIYGWTDYRGLSILRRFDIENAVRHEFGHMIGLATLDHHPGCAMAYDCDVYDFCENCRREISEIWELV